MSASDRDGPPEPPICRRCGTGELEEARPGDIQHIATLPADPSSASAARRLVDQWLAEAGVGDDADIVTLLVSELVTNALLHAQSEMELRVDARRGAITVEVADASPVEPTHANFGDASITGRGLALVQSLASSWGVDPVPGDGKVVWFRLAADPSADTVPVAEARGRTDEVSCALVDAPLLLLEASTAHDADLLREVTLMTLGTDERAETLRDVARAAERARTALLASWARAEYPHGSPRATVRLSVSADLAGDLRCLDAILDRGDQLADGDELLTPPALPEVRAARRWALAQLAAQLEGGKPERWEDAELERTRPMFEQLDAGTVLDVLSDGVIAADASNTIVFANGAAERLLGWDHGSLRGQRLAVIVPPRLRDAHVAGFTRLLVGGHGRILGRPVRVAALRRDGTELDVDLTVTASGGSASSIFVATLRDVRERIELERRAAVASYLALVNQVTTDLLDEQDAVAAAQRALASVGGGLGWRVGAVWVVDGARLRCLTTWTGDERGAEEFIAATASTELEVGIGLPGRVVEARQPVWITDVVDDTNFPRVAAASRLGLRGAFAFPILARGNVIGAIEFFADERVHPDDDIATVLAAVGVHLGAVLLRPTDRPANRP